jgi:carbamoyltransferase
MLNLKVKYRESFRPFAPSILCEEVTKWFELETASPYMLFVANIKSDHRIEMRAEEKELFGISKLNVLRSTIPSVTHVDYTARVQTVHSQTNPLYYKLIERFREITGCPLLVNTSFNIRGEPIVCSPVDAFNCFMGTELDMLIVGNSILEKSNQTKSKNIDYKERYELD